MQILILVIMGLVLLVGWIISSIQQRALTARTNNERLRRIKQKWGNRKIDKGKSLEERNQDIIQEHLSRLRAGYHRSYYIENSVRDCVQEIAEAENSLAIAPNHEYLSTWERRATPKYFELKNSLLKRFRERHEGLNRTQQQEEDKAINEESQRLREKYSDLISQFYDITERKVSLLDDYGDQTWEALSKEIDALIRKIAKKEGHTDEALKRWKKYDFDVPKPYRRLISFLDESFKKHHELERAKPSDQIDYSKLSGVEFEVFLMKLLTENGFS
jgi:hypothetical protein